jgi:hypothetical protein
VLRSDVEVLKKLEKSGLVALSFGVESLKKKTLRFYGKGQSVADIEKAMRMMQETNILLICNFILGSPGETEEDMMDMLWFGRKWDVDTLVTNRLSVPEYSPLFTMIYDAETGQVKPGMERIEGEELARIKYRVKFAQRTPLRTLLSLLKLYRHRGMFIDPLYALCCALETFTRYTWLEKTKVFPLFLRAVKRLTSFAVFRQITRLIAILVTPPVRLINWVFELIDKPLGISTTLLPKFFLFLQHGMYRKQSLQVQTRAQKVSGD